MALQHSPKIQAQIIEMVARGEYPDADSMLEEALELLSEHERLVDLKAMIAVGVEEVAQGKVVEFTAELREKLWQSAQGPESKDDRLNHIRELVAEGAEQARRGELIAYNEQFREEVKREALRRFAEGEFAGPDVRP